MHHRLAFAIFAIALVVPAVVASETVVTRYDHPLDLRAATPRSFSQPGTGFGRLPGKTAVASNSWLIPYLVVDQNDPNGEVTLFSLRHEGEDMAEAGTITVGFRDIFRTIIGTLDYTLQPNQVQTVNPRFALQLPTDSDGITRGFVEILGDIPFSVDYFQIDGTNDFASGDNGASFPNDFCEYWKIRFLNGGPFDGGTEMIAVVNGPLGTGPMDPPTISGNVYREDGTFVNAFEIRTNEWLVIRDAADLVNSGNPFGAIELRIDAEDANTGFVFARQDASGRYSVALNGVCKDAQFTEK